MNQPALSNHFDLRKPSAIRKAQIEFSKRNDKNEIDVINLAIGNVSLPMYPAMREKLRKIGNDVFKDGVIKYTSTSGTKNARNAFLNILSAEGIETDCIYPLVTDGGSTAMELMILGVCGPASKNSLLLFDPAYTNYLQFARRLSVPILSSDRVIEDDGSFSSLDLNEIESIVKKYKPSGILVIPFDNPTGQFLNKQTMIEIAKIAVKNNIWLISDEAYRPLSYNTDSTTSVWALKENDVSGITGRRISIESASKVWNACGLRIGGLLTDNKEFYNKSISEYTANLCANTIGQEIFGVMSTEPRKNILNWYKKQRQYYKSILFLLKINLEKEIPGIIVSNPEAAIYCVIDLKNIVSESFDAEDFIQYCAREGKIDFNGTIYTVLLAPMTGFYNNKQKGKTQLRIAIVEEPEKMKIAPLILSKLFNTYLKKY